MDRRYSFPASRVQLGQTSDRFLWLARLATFVLVVAILRVGQEVLVPVAFAVLLAFLLSPVVVRLTRWRLPKALAIIVTVSLAFALIGAIGWIVSSQVMALAKELPKYEENLRQKITTLKHPRAPDGVERMVGMVENLRRELQTEVPDKPVTPASPNETRPVPVEIRPMEPTPWQVALGIVKPFLRPLGTTGIVIVFVVAMLFQRDDLRDRFIRVVSGGKLNIATQAIDDAASRVSRYLGMQLVVNALYGIPIGLGLAWIGIPNALLWGLLATLLRFIPFVGPWIAAAFPIALSIAVDPGWTMLLYTAGLFVVMEVISNNLIELVLYGASTGISNLALLVAAVFWTWLWGWAGLVLSTPLTVCLLVLGNYVPGMAFLRMLLGSEPVLAPPAQFYQRLLAMESEDSFDVATKFIAEHSLEEFYEEVFVPALLMSEEDRHSGALPETRQRFIFQASRDLIDELERQDEIAHHGTDTTKAVTETPAALPTTPTVLIVPARDEADELVARALTHLLRRRGVSTALNLHGAPLDDALRAVERGHARAIIVSALPPSATLPARQLCRRIRLRCPDVPTVVGLWRHRAKASELAARFDLPRPEAIVTTLKDAVDEMERRREMLTRSHPPFSGRVDQPLARA